MTSSVDKGVVDVLINGGVVVMPSDTVYGLISSALQPVAVARIFKIKKRINKLGTLLFANEQQLLDFGFSKADVQKASSYWPSSTSVILPAPKSKEYLARGWGSLAVRIPKPEWLLELLEQSGPLATTSANYPDQPTVTTIEEAKELFGDKVDLYIDGGKIDDVKPSKIVRIDEDGAVTVLRD